MIVQFDTTCSLSLGFISKTHATFRHALLI